METKKIQELVIEGVTYVPRESQSPSPKLDGLDYVIVRTYSAGVFAGYLKQRAGREVELTQARRLWYWEGANSLSDLASIGTTKPDKCKFSRPIDVVLTEAIEIISVTNLGFVSITGVALWTQK